MAAPCRFFAQGSCRAGPSCRFSHAQSSAAPTSTAAPICRFHQQKPGSCRNGDSCHFRHDPPSVPAVKRLPPEQPKRPTVSPPGPAKTVDGPPETPKRPTLSMASPPPAPSPSGRPQGLSHLTDAPYTPLKDFASSTPRTPVTPLFSPRSLLTQSLRDDDERSDATTSTSAGGEPVLSLQDFEILVQIGDGLVGRVYVVRHHASGGIYAMKVMEKGQIVSENMHTIIAEREVLEEVRHPFIVRLHFAFQTAEKLILVMEFLPGGDLAYHLRSKVFFDEPTCRFYAAEIALALQHLHKNHIIHRDMKCANIVLDEEGHIRLTDFGMSKKLRDDDGSRDIRGNNTYCGTDDYMAPEIRASEGHGVAADWWSFGVILFEMLVGQRPFNARDEASAMAKLNAGTISFPEFPKISSDAKKLLRKLLVRDPSARIGIDDILRDPFFRGVNWQALTRKEVSPPMRPYVDRDEDVYVGNFPSSITDRTPPDADDLAAALAAGAKTYTFRSFTYMSPSLAADVAALPPSAPTHLGAPPSPMSACSDEELTRLDQSHERLFPGVPSASLPIRSTQSPVHEGSGLFSMSPLQ